MTSNGAPLVRNTKYQVLTVYANVVFVVVLQIGAKERDDEHLVSDVLQRVENLHVMVEIAR